MRKNNMKIGLIDADLIGNGTKHPNLALMKISAYHEEFGNSTQLIDNYEQIGDFDKVYVSKVFTYTPFPNELLQRPNIEYGGTGFFMEDAPDLPSEIEHHMPNYHLYDKFVEEEISSGVRPIRFKDYVDYSLGFTTRGCFRGCEFCVNKKYTSVVRHASVSEFVDPSRKYIYLWDDNVLGYKKWYEIFEELEQTGKRFQFKQGLDMRLMTNDKANVLSKARYIGDYIFAFDFLKDRNVMEKKLKIWREHCSKTTKLYILCAYESQDSKDIISVFERLTILMKYRCIPYIMRYEDYNDSEFRGIYINLARWCNQPNIFKKMSFREFCEANGENSSSMRYYNYFVEKHPGIAQKYFDLKFETTPRAY